MSDDHQMEEPVRTSRDADEVKARLTDWLRDTTGDADATIGGLSTPSGSGMSSETLLVDATWADETRELVVRMAPSAEDIPVFREYDLELQFRVLQLVGANSSVPVPTARWLEPDGTRVGSPFFVMDREHGRVPPDIPPYLFEGWLLDADPSDQATLQRSSIQILVDLHGIDIGAHDTAFLETPGDGATPLRRHVDAQYDFYEWVRGDRRHPLIDDAFAWLEDNWPDEGPPAISWGDARIGNVMYEPDGFSPVAVFDWEMAGIAPVEVDLGWMVFLHQFFQNIAEVFELPGMTAFMQRADVVSTYQELCGTLT